MKHVRIAFYDLTNGTYDELNAVVRRPGGMLDAFRHAPGFVAYGLADTGDETLASLTIWDTRADADAAVEVAREWVAANVADRVTLTANRVGDLAFLEGATLVTA
jgi:heme-degrading monooxygenase HmoA